MQTAFAPDSGAVSRGPGLSVPPNLDSIAYERRVPAPASYAQAPPPQVAQAHAPAAPPVHRQSRAQPGNAMDAHAPIVPVVAQPAADPAYRLDTGDKLRVVVFGQDGLSNSYFVDAAGQVTIPLIGAVSARGLTTQALARAVGAKLRAGFIRDPHVAIEVETYRPFFILGEVTQPGQYPYVPNMTVETAVAIAGGFTPRAYRYDVKIDRPAAGETLRSRAAVPLLTRVEPGDTIVIKERWF
ncbi:MAG: polysaccharide export protein [Xanthobacteraceae bacterium]|nr:polysaccharide export protein [Xanthobacteraceae bacterium]